MFAVRKPTAKAGEPQRLTWVAQRPRHAAVNQAHLLQRSIGTQAMLGPLAQRADNTWNGTGAHKIETDPTSLTAHNTAPVPAWNFSSIPPFAPGESNESQVRSVLASPQLPGPIQAKLEVGQVDDPLEREANRITDQVMRMPDPEVSIAARRPQLSRQGDACKGEGTLRTRPAAPAAASGAAPAIVYEVLRSPGQPLDAPTRAYFEPRFGYDFSRVRVHADEPAADAARSVAARAFTVDDHIVFGDRQYAPDGTAGRRLLAHELAHTIQQRIAPATAGILRQPAPQPIPGWNFTPMDLLRLRESGRTLTIAADSGFFPANLQENLVKTLLYVLGPAILPPATEGINALDFFHGHLVVKKSPATAKQVEAARAKGEKFGKTLSAERAKALGGEVTFSKGYPFDPKSPSTPGKIAAYQKAVEKVLPSFGALLDEGSKLPGAAVMYHTFEFKQPRDLKVKGERLAAEDPRRHYVTPLDTNKPTQYTPPSGGYETEYTIITSFTFLVDDKGAVHVRPLSTSTGFTTLELSTITGAPFPEPLEPEK
jgi:hypothetical protein